MSPDIYPADFYGPDYPDASDSAALYDELDYQRAVQAYIWATPLLVSAGLKRGLVAAGVTPDTPSLLIFNRRLTPKQVIMTASAEVVYAFTILDLSQTGPIVVEIPKHCSAGSFDFWHGAVKDMVNMPFNRSGGRYLVLPPGYTDVPPADYTVAQARTRQVFFGGKGVVTPGEGVEPQVEMLSRIRIYPLARRADPPPLRIILGDGAPFNSDWPKDSRYFDWMAEALSQEVALPEDAAIWGMLKPLGIEKGQPFAPDARLRAIFDRAAATGAAMVANLTVNQRSRDARIWPDRQWSEIVFTTAAHHVRHNRQEIDERAPWYALVGNVEFFYGGMTLPPGMGVFYANAHRDGAGHVLNGTHRYRLTIPANPPARQFWSITTYDIRTRSFIDTDQQRSSLSSYDDLAKNDDGSIDVHFAPEAPHGHAGNWIKTIPGVGFFAMFRLYGPLMPYYDKGWVLDDFERVA